MEEEEWWKAQPSRPTVTKRSPLLLLSPLVRERGGNEGSCRRSRNNSILNRN